MKNVVMINVPIPKEVEEIAKSRGVPSEELAKAAQKLLLMEIIAMESELSMEDAITLSKKVNKSLWKNLQ